ncbi:MAG TPA: flagellar assembly protein FliW, partial [Firmicutes bacterium]|nr:flagellar assembly protein FliW [Bacillota bacterium]
MIPQQSAQQITEQGKPAIYFSRGLPGLECYRWFEVKQVPENRFFLLLQSREEAAVGMILLDPFPMFPEYRCRLTGPDLEDLELN